MAFPAVETPCRSFTGKVSGEGEYFVMGDNSDNSKDSRIFEVVRREKIVSEATRVVMSFDKPDEFQPCWNKFSMPLK
ncbi:S26 family signal peptidase [Akkermansiaceae bacterium]|nr:S26 family signal peptidase [Akkermansiaceae bacterium]